MEITEKTKVPEHHVNDRFLLVVDYLIEIRKCRNYTDFWEQLGFTKNLPQKTQKIKEYHQKVTISLLLLIGTVFNVNINYLLGFEKEMFRGE